MLSLNKTTAEVLTVKGKTYYVFPMPTTKENQVDRPTKYVKESDCTVYTGRGSNGSAKLLPKVHEHVNA